MPFPFASLLAVALVLATMADAACTGPPRDDSRCGSPAFGMARCAPNECCSQRNWCGNSPDHCNPDICAESFTFPGPPGSGPMPTTLKTPVLDFSPEERPAQRGQIQLAAIQGIGRRVEITSMSPAELTVYRDAWARIMRGGEDSIYFRIAQDHGVPFFYCPHGNLRFLPWHRRYCDRVEEALGVPLAYWDWTQGGRIPQAFAQQTYINSRGVRVPNPLFAGVLPSGELTSRNPRLTPSRFQAVAAFAQEQNSFSRFSRILESVHDNVHGAIGRTMSMVSIASFDPIFMGHHAFVDYQWWIWQLSHPDATYDQEARGPMDDSIGTFMGAFMIQDQSGWLRGRSPNNLPRARASAIFSEPQLFLILKNVSSLAVSTEISVIVDDIVLAQDIRFGMQGMNRIDKDFTMYVDPKAANILWREKKVPLEQIPGRAKVWLTVNGVQIKVLDDIAVEMEWMQTG